MSVPTTVDLRARHDTYTLTPGDLSFDRPSREELLELALDTVGELAGCGFTDAEIREMANLMGMVLASRKAGRN